MENIDYTERLNGVHPDLIKVITEAARTFKQAKIRVVEGVRTPSRQLEMYKSGASRTLASKHLKQKDGYSHAVDTAVIVDGKIPWGDKKLWRAWAKHQVETGKRLGVKVRNGGDWSMNGVFDEEEIAAYVKQYGRKPLVDYPHTELV